MQNKIIEVSSGGVRVQLSTSSFNGLPAVEEIEASTGEYDLVLSEKRELEYNDIAISLEDFRKIVEGYNQILERIDKELANE